MMLSLAQLLLLFHLALIEIVYLIKLDYFCLTDSDPTSKAYRSITFELASQLDFDPEKYLSEYSAPNRAYLLCLTHCAQNCWVKLSEDCYLLRS
jgi:hypothetical protein